MSSQPVIDLEQLLTPVSSDNPCGENLRWDPLYDEIKEARREEDKDALGAGEAVEANWSLVSSKATDAVATRSKDIMLAGYLLEALVQQHGFAGLRDGLRGVNGLLEQFWDGLYPQADGEDLEPRAAPVVWFTEADRGARLPSRVRDISIAPGSNNGVPYSWAFWKSRFPAPKGEGEDGDAFARRRAEAEDRAKLFEEAAAAAPFDYYAGLREDLAECRAEVARLDTLLDERFGRAAPGTSALRQSLDECAALVERIFKEKGGLGAEAATTEEAGEAAVAGGATPVAGAAVGPIASRADALRRLSDVAAFFRQTEPHSPVSYLVERAMAWGSMSFEQLLTELVKDSSTRQQIGELLGFKTSE